MRCPDAEDWQQYRTAMPSVVADAKKGTVTLTHPAIKSVTISIREHDLSAVPDLRIYRASNGDLMLSHPLFEQPVWVKWDREPRASFAIADDVTEREWNEWTTEEVLDLYGYPELATEAVARAFLEDLFCLVTRHGDPPQAVKLLQGIEAAEKHLATGDLEALNQERDGLVALAQRLIDALHTHWMAQKHRRGPKRGGERAGRRLAIERHIEGVVENQPTLTTNQIWATLSERANETKVEVDGDDYIVFGDGVRIYQELDSTGKLKSIVKSTFERYVAGARKRGSVPQ